MTKKNIANIITPKIDKFYYIFVAEGLDIYVRYQGERDLKQEHT